MFNLTIDKEISLRTLHPDDAGEFFMLVEQNRTRLRPWIDPGTLPGTARAARIFAIECFFNSLNNPMDAILLHDHYFQELDHYFPPLNPPMEMGIWVKGGLAGMVSMSRLQDSFSAAEFGYWISAQQEGKGMITRSVSALMDYAIQELKIKRFVIGCAVNNSRSRAVPERLGYRLHATQPNGEIVGEFVYDRAIYGIRSTAWCQRNKVNAH